MSHPAKEFLESQTQVPSQRQEEARLWFEGLRDRICATFEAIERDFAADHGGTPGTFEKTPWTR